MTYNSASTNFKLATILDCKKDVSVKIYSFVVALGMSVFCNNSLLAGTYKIEPYYKGENKVFDVTPSLAVVSVEHQHVTIPQKFQVSSSNADLDCYQSFSCFCYFSHLFHVLVVLNDIQILSFQ